MKYLILSLSCFFLLTSTTAQQGIVTYSSVRGLNLAGDDDNETPPDILKMLPTELKAQSQLTFTSTATSYQNTSGGEEINKGEEGDDVQMKIKIEPSKDIYYLDLSNNQVIQQRSLLGKDFLVSGAAPDFQWQETGATATVAGLPVRHATGINLEGDTLQAWYTPSLKIASGPEGYGGLPGLILKLEIPAKQLSMLAENIEMIPNLDLVLTVPSDGKPIELREFTELRRKKLAEQPKGMRVITREIRN
jgi:GLPGLI family protein